MAEKDTTIYEESCDKIWKKYENKFHYTSFLKTLIENRRFFIWGASNKSDWIMELCQRARIEINGYIDSNSELLQYGRLQVYRPDILS